MSGIQMAAVGLGSVLKSLTNATASTQRVAGNCNTAITFGVDGSLVSVHKFGTPVSSINDRWCNPAGNPAASIRATLTSGTAPNTAGVLNTWLPLSSDVSWENATTVTGVVTSTLLIEISLNGGTTVATSASYTITAERL